MSDILSAHKHSANHRSEIIASDRCGCFYCLSTFSPTEIKDWIDWPEGTPEAQELEAGSTALCPKCGIDSVIGDQSGHPIEEAFLRSMQKHWF
jgi:hypothetical protein